MTIQETLAAERAKYPTPLNSPALAVTILNATAYAHRADGWGLLAKSLGTNYDGKALDILFNRLTGLHYDVLRDAEGDAEPVWSEVAPMDLSRWLAPVPPDGHAELKADIAALKAELLAQGDALSRRIAALEAATAPEPQPWPFPITVVTTTKWGHHHTVTINKVKP